MKRRRWTLYAVTTNTRSHPNCTIVALNTANTASDDYSPSTIGPFHLDKQKGANKPCKQSRHTCGLTKKRKRQPSSTHPFSRIQRSRTRHLSTIPLRARSTYLP